MMPPRGKMWDPAETGRQGGNASVGRSYPGRKPGNDGLTRMVWPLHEIEAVARQGQIVSLDQRAAGKLTRKHHIAKSLCPARQERLDGMRLLPKAQIPDVGGVGKSGIL